LLFLTMQFIKLTFVLIFISVLYSACIKEVKPATRIEKSILVVEGSITTDKPPYTVKLTYSGPYKFALDIPDEFLEKNARVAIKDNLGNETQLAYKEKGIYETVDTNYIGIPGRSYNVVVELNNGKTYVSKPEKINDPVPLENFKVNFVSDFNFVHPAYLQVSIDAKDPAVQGNYYKWN